MNIKKSIGNCLECPASKNKSLIPYTNYPNDLTKIDLLIIIDKFSKKDLKNNRIASDENIDFHQIFNKYKLNKQKYLITSVSLCDVTDIEDEEIISNIHECCKENINHLIETCNPKLILSMGVDFCKLMNIKSQTGNNVFAYRGKIYDYKKYKLFVSLDLETIKENKNTLTLIESDFSKVFEIITGKKSEIKNISNNIKMVGNGLQYYNIPDKFYTNEYRLVDIQFLYKSSEILYIFRDYNNKKIYYKHNDNFYFYQSSKNDFDKKILSKDNIVAYNVSWKNRNDIDTDISYESDVRLPIKHAIDYGIKNKEDCDTKYLNNWFFDIELDMKDTEAFPKIEDAKFPINMISVSYNGKNTIYILDNNTAKIEKRNDNYEYKIFNKEINLIKEFINDFKSNDPDTISGWNTNYFDLPYLYYRLQNLNINPNVFSPKGIFDVDLKWNRVFIAGVSSIDQLEIYRLFEFGKKASYKLDNIANYELGIKKIELEESISKMYKKDINKLIDYNIRDTDLLVQLEEKIGQINLVHEIRKVCSSTISAIMSTFGQVDPLMISFMKKKGYVVKNAIRTGKEKLVGAFVKQPDPGIYEYFVDFDFTSLYPSIIRTYNIGVETFAFRFADSTMGYDITYQPEKLPEKIKIIFDPNYENKELIVDKNKLLKRIQDSGLIWTINGCFYLPHSEKTSEFAEILEYVMSSRKVYKNKKFEAIQNKDKLMASVYDTRQLVYKVLANSFYGVIANENFRFFNIHSAGAITASGQEAIKICIIKSHNKIEELLTNKPVEYEPLTKKEIYSDELNKNRNIEHVITSDTDSIFCCLEKFDDISINKIKDYCRIIQDYLNNDVIVEMIKKHNHSGDSKFNFLNMKNELICSKGLFVAKKHYVIHVVEQEGKKVDNIVHVGIDTKRSEIPKGTKEFLNELIEMIFKDENFSIKKLTQFIAMKEIEFRNRLKKGDKDLSKTISFTKHLNNYKGNHYPQHIVAMMNWNLLVSNQFQTGDKGNIFYINGVDELKMPENILKNYYDNFIKTKRKLKTIAVPEDVNALPEYFIINVKEMMRTVFYERYEKLLKPVIQIQKNNQSVLTF